MITAKIVIENLSSKRLDKIPILNFDFLLGVDSFIQKQEYLSFFCKSSHKLEIENKKYKINDIIFITNIKEYILYAHYISQSGAYKGYPIIPMMTYTFKKMALSCNIILDNTFCLLATLNGNEILELELSIEEIV